LTDIHPRPPKQATALPDSNTATANMASFFQSFSSSRLPKQLLRFALSRLDLIDPQALDLENLDFAIGRNSVLEFRDVGLILQVPYLHLLAS
jgi:hypothetical protein